MPAENQNRDPASAKRSRFDTRPSGPASGIFVDRAPFPPNARPEDFQLPVAESDTVLLGSVANVQPYLSEDGTSLYTEFTVSAEELLKDSAGLSLNRDSVLTLFRIGGSLRLASGRVLRTDVHGLGDPPAANHRYVCFLNYDARGYWFRIVKLWELRNGVAAPNDPFDKALGSRGEVAIHAARTRAVSSAPFVMPWGVRVLNDDYPAHAGIGCPSAVARGVPFSTTDPANHCHGPERGHQVKANQGCGDAWITGELWDDSRRSARLPEGSETGAH